ncbi:MAG: 4,5-dihydroxyphthalate decarboxylase [Rhodospirillaceae bacterium]|nr:4,5-dihydroxyphthalate decarboxylase [Rhodospirillaceae bacterium]
MSDLHLTMAINHYDHVQDLASGRVKPEGIDLTVINHGPEEIFHRFLFGFEWQISEISMGMSTSRLSMGNAPFVLIPIFPSRVFRHSSIYMMNNGPVKTPDDLKGKRIGIPEWGQTAGIYTRGWMVHTAGVGLNEVKWFQSGINEPGRQEASTLNLPEDVSLTVITDRSLTQMLFDKDLDCVFSARPPKEFLEGDPRIIQMYPDFRSAEEEYFKETGIFPIMHTVAVRKDVFEKNPWVAQNLMTAFEDAKALSYARMSGYTVSHYPVPWLYHDGLRENQKLFKGDFWPYGIEPNKTTLTAFLEFAWEQGTIHKKLSIEDLFPEEVRHHYKL